MANTVEIILSAKDAENVRAWQNAKNSIQAYNAQLSNLDQIQRRSGASAQRQDAAFASMAGKLTGISSATDLVAKGLALISNEWENIIQRQEKSLQLNMTYAQSLATLAFNTAGDPVFNELSKVEAEIFKISKETGVGINEVARSVSNAASAKGQLPLQAAFDSVRATLKFAPQSPGLQDVMAGGALDVRKMYPESTPEQAIGFTAMLGQQARITDPQKVAENALPATLLMSKIDKGSLRENAAIYSAITQATGDVQGRTSRTGGIGLALQLEKVLPELGSTLERVMYMQNNPELANQFLNGGGKFKGKGLSLHVKGPDGEDITFGTDQASFEKKVIPAIRELLTKGSTTDINMRSALESIPELKDAGAVYEKQRAGLQASPAFKVAIQEQSLTSSVERSSVGNTKGAKSASVRKGLTDLMQAEGFSWTEQWAAGTERFMREAKGESSGEAALNALRERKRLLRHFANPDADQSLNLKQVEKYDKIEAELLRAEELANPGYKVRDIERQGVDLKNQYNAARSSGDTEKAGELRSQIDVLSDILSEMKRGSAAPNVQVVMPGGGAPAKPVAAASIGPGGNRP